MAEFHFLKGSFKGRLGDVVFSSWRGHDYAKTYTKPSDPHTAKQVAHREVWKQLSLIAKGIYPQVLRPYTFPKPQAHTNYNEFLMLNKGMLHSNLLDLPALKIFNGSLTGSAVSAYVYDTATKKLKFTWTTALIGAMKATDKAIGIVIQDNLVVGYGITNRGAGTLEIATAEFQKIKNGPAHGYMVFVQEPTPGTAETGMTSGTQYKSVAVSGLIADAPDGVLGGTPASSAATAGGTP